MNQINQLMLRRLASNEKILGETKTALEKIKVKGELYICHGSGICRFYRRSDDNTSDRTYISKNNKKLLSKLANKKYYRRVITLLEKENAWIIKSLKSSPIHTYEQVYIDDLEMRALINPVYKSDEEVLAQWESLTYESNPYKPELKKHKTNKGEYVRSKSEKIIADKLYELGIPYKYEYPIVVNGVTRYVDFFILSIPLRKAFMLEHFGMMSSQEYVKDAVDRIHDYEKAGIILGDKLIATFEYDNESIDMNAFETMIKERLQIQQ